MKCSTGKKSYPTEPIAIDALVEAQSTFDYGKSGGPIAVYLCDECGSYHLTSKGPIHSVLNELINSGELRRRREARNWENRLK